MSELLQFAVLGLGAGAVYAALGTGVVLTYQAAGVVNIALGALAMYVAYTYSLLVGEGRLVLPVGSVEMAGTSEGVAIALCLAIAALLGLAAYLLVFRPLRSAPPALKLVATVGITVLLQALAVLRFSTGVSTVPAILPDAPIQIAGATIPRDRLYLAGIVFGLALLLWAFNRFTRTGLAMRAVAEDEQAATLLGHSPQRLSALAWSGSAVVAGLVGILAGPVTGLNPVTNSLFVIPALAVAIIGRLRSFGVTVAAGLALGMSQGVLLKLQADLTWLPTTGLREALPFVVIVVALMAVGGRLPARGSDDGGSMPAVPRGLPSRWLALGTVAAGAALVLVLDGPYRTALTTSIVAILVCLSIVVLTGMLGQISLAQMTFAGASGFVLSALTSRADVPFPLAPLLAVGAAVLVGMIVAVPALRIRGVTLGVVTLALGMAVSEFVFKNPDWTGGLGGTRIPELAVFGLSLSGGDRGFALFALAVVTVLSLAVVHLRRTRLGGQMLLVRANERAAAAVGVNVAGVKLAGFAIAAGLAGTAGTLLGYQQQSLSFQDFDVFVSLAYVAVVYLSGIGRVAGAVIAGLLAPGGLLFYALERWLHLGEYSSLVSALGLIAVLVTLPDGLAGEFDRKFRRLRGRDGGKRAADRTSPDLQEDIHVNA